MNTADIITYTRDLLDVPESLAPWTEAELLRYVNRAMKQVYARAMWVNGEYFLQNSTGAELGFNFTRIGSENKWETIYPDYVRHIARVETREGNLVQVEVPHTKLRKYDREVQRQSFLGEGQASQWFFSGHKRLVMTEDPTAELFNVWYTKVPPDMVRFQAAAGSTVNTIVVNVLTGGTLGTLVGREGEYVGAIVEVTSATSLPPQGEIAEVTGYTGTYPNFTFTLDRDLSAAIGPNDVIDMHPSLYETEHELLAYLAAVRALDRKGAGTHKAVLAGTAEFLYNQFILSIEKRQTQAPQKQIVPSMRQ